MTSTFRDKECNIDGYKQLVAAADPEDVDEVVQIIQSIDSKSDDRHTHTQYGGANRLLVHTICILILISGGVMSPSIGIAAIDAVSKISRVIPEGSFTQFEFIYQTIQYLFPKNIIETTVKGAALSALAKNVLNINIENVCVTALRAQRIMVHSILDYGLVLGTYFIGSGMAYSLSLNMYNKLYNIVDEKLDYMYNLITTNSNNLKSEIQNDSEIVDATINKSHVLESIFENIEISNFIIHNPKMATLLLKNPDVIQTILDNMDLTAKVIQLPTVKKLTRKRRKIHKNKTNHKTTQRVI
tara:strand:+ start:83 stop:979 length:897 start_codon:yes stop_codon:yes gene_type:complete